MKKIWVWIIGGIGSFILLVGIIFMVLNYLEKEDENSSVTVTSVNNSGSSQLLDQIKTETDSLVAEVDRLKSELFFSNIEKDSLLEELKFNENIINGYKETIDDLNADLLESNNVKVRIKELAKTYETMKSEEMKPILENVDDETVIAIYENMSSRTRKTIMKAISAERAAIITKRLAGIDTG